MRESVIYQEILREGELKGELKGRQQGKSEVALNLLRNQMTVEQVISLTGLPESLVKELAQSLVDDGN